MSFLAICALTLIPQSGQPETTPYCIVCGSLGGVDFLLNVLLFAPLGIGLWLAGLPALPAVLAMLGFSTFIELSQFFFVSGRDASIGDVISNSLGGTLGFFVARHFFILRSPTRRTALVLFVCWSFIWLGIQVASSYAFAITLPVSRYYGQIARVFGNMATFGGQVLSATVDTVSIPNFGYAKTEQFRALLLESAPVVTTVIPSGPTPKIAPIVRIADAEKQEIVLLGQDHADLVFGVRTGAAAMRLRPQLFALRGVFPAAGDGARLLVTDTLRLQGIYSPALAELRADSGEMVRRRAFAISPALAWTLILPANWYIEGTRVEAILSALWVALLLLPLGYWAWFLIRANDGTLAVRGGFMITTVFALLVTGLLIVPRFFGQMPLSAPLSFVAAAGFSVGAALAVSTSLGERTSVIEKEGLT